MKRLLICFILLLAFVHTQAQQKDTLLTPVLFQQLINSIKKSVLIDVRTPAEFEEGHIENAININWQGENFLTQISQMDKSTPVFVYCKGGGRSASAVQALRKAGFEDVYDLQGGITNWKNNQLPINLRLDQLKTSIQLLIENKKTKVAVSMVSNDYKDTISIYGNEKLPMQSVFKFPIALAVLDLIDQGKFTIDQEILITKKDLLPDTWSPIRDTYPNGVKLTIAQLIEYTVAQSDNNGCDILLRLIGGPAIVEKYLAKHDFHNIAIKINEEIMQSHWDKQFLNWATTQELTSLLIKSYNNEQQNMLSAENHKFIWKVMRETSTGMKRLKSQLPTNTFVAHKTGTSGTNKQGITAAINDSGVILLPNGKPIFITVFVTDSSESNEVNEKIIADIAKVVWDYYTKASI